MIAGAVAPPGSIWPTKTCSRHLHSVWLSRCRHGRSIVEGSISKPGLPCCPKPAVDVARPLRGILAAFRELRRRRRIERAGWFPNGSAIGASSPRRSIRPSIAGASSTVRRSSSATPGGTSTASPARADREEAERQERGEARDRSAAQLGRPPRPSSTPYRYLAGEGFIPGYNSRACRSGLGLRRSGARDRPAPVPRTRRVRAAQHRLSRGT